ncbi:MAG: protein-export chaperone SecB [Pseudomonadota bacterium]|nr:protein-export chaperone SecB [Pseudomonadota bacterium]
MAKKKTDAKDGAPKDGAGGAMKAPAAGPGEGPAIAILAQYVKDLSFESPNAPKSLQSPGTNPKLNININVQVARQADEVFEVSLLFEGKTTNDEGVIYNIELVYGSVFRLQGIPENTLQKVLFVDCPTLMFPYLRRTVSDLTQEGGFPPLYLDPIDFGRLYVQNADRIKSGRQPAAN